MTLTDGDNDRPGRDDFARALLAVIHQCQPFLRLQYDPDRFQLLAADGECRSNLANIYEEHCRIPPGERPRHLEMLARIFGELDQQTPPTYEAARSHLRQKIWTRATFEELALRNRIQGCAETLRLPMRDLGPHLVVSLVYDLPAAMRSVSERELDEWNVTVYQAMEDAAMNLAEAGARVTAIGEGFFAIMNGDSYDSSRILMLDLVRSLEVTGTPVAMVPQRDSLYVAGSDDHESLTVMLDLTEQVVRNEPRPLAPIPLQLVDDAWIEWMPEPGHPLAHRFRQLRQQFLGSLYASQKALLEELCRKEQVDVFVASYSGLQVREPDRVYSYCVWAEGADSLLPETDLVMLPGEFSMDTCGEWARVRRVAGALMQPVPDLYPARYRVREFPSQLQLEEIGVLKPGA